MDRNSCEDDQITDSKRARVGVDERSVGLHLFLHHISRLLEDRPLTLSPLHDGLVTSTGGAKAKLLQKREVLQYRTITNSAKTRDEHILRDSLAHIPNSPAFHDEKCLTRADLTEHVQSEQRQLGLLPIDEWPEERRQTADEHIQWYNTAI